MIQYHLAPQSPLAPFVHSFWLSDTTPRPPSKERVLPTGTIEVLIHLRDDQSRAFDSIVCGAHSTPFVIDASQKASVLSVHFHPGGAFPFLGVPADALHNLTVPLDCLWGVRALQLREQLLLAPSPGVMFGLLERALVAQLALAPAPHPAVRGALHAFETLVVSHQCTPLAELADSLGVSQRRLRQVFGAQVGLSPKRYWRIQRFQAVLHSINQQRSLEVDWSEIALACGYYDQAHFNHDFHAFSGLAPSNYVIVRGPQLNHILLPE